MSKKRTIIILGLMVALLPVLGIPRIFSEWLSALTGLAIAAIAFFLHRKTTDEAKVEKNDTFSQNGTHGAIPASPGTKHNEPSVS